MEFHSPCMSSRTILRALPLSVGDDEAYRIRLAVLDGGDVQSASRSGRLRDPFKNGFQRGPSSSFLTKSDHRVFSGSLWSASTAYGRHEACRRKGHFLSALKRPVEHTHSKVVSYRQKTTDRPC
jgi:hypothetical protein